MSSTGHLDHEARVASAAARLGRAGLEPLVAELARRFGAGGGAVVVAIRLTDLSDVQRSALADLFGLARRPPQGAEVRVDRLCAKLGLDSVAALRESVERLVGPLSDRTAIRAAADAERADLWAWFDARCVGIGIAGLGHLHRWPTAVRREGVRRSVGEQRAVLEAALRVVGTLPVDGVPLAVLAADLLHDPHGLDRGTRLGRLVTAAVADAAQQPAPVDAEQTREVWRLVGVETDPLSSTVLTLGLRAPDTHALAPFLNPNADASEPVSMTLSQLVRWPLPPADPGSVTYVVENPSLLAAAARRPWGGPPLVCSSGRPSIAVVRLLRQLGARGATLRQHADFDAAGVGICAWLADRAGTTPWSMGADDYRTLLGDVVGRLPIEGPVPATPWDPDLAGAMQQAGQAAFEEEMSTELLDTIAAVGSIPPHGPGGRDG